MEENSFDFSQVSEFYKSLTPELTKYGLWKVKSSRGGVLPTALSGTFVSKAEAEKTIKIYIIQKHYIKEQEEQYIKRKKSKKTNG